VKQTLIVTVDVTGQTETALLNILDHLLATPTPYKGALKYNLVDIAPDDVIAAEHALIDIVQRARKER
jgi:hypothetical protein